jgi:hypothetical protein
MIIVALDAVKESPSRLTEFGSFNVFLQWAVKTFHLPLHKDHYFIYYKKSAKATYKLRSQSVPFPVTKKCYVKLEHTPMNKPVITYEFVILQTNLCC